MSHKNRLFFIKSKTEKRRYNMVEVYILSDVFEQMELEKLATDEINFEKMITLNLTPEVVMMVAIECVKNIGYSALYDSLKYILSSINAKMAEKVISGKKTVIDISCSEKHYRFETELPVSDEIIKEINSQAIKSIFKE